MGGVSTDRTTFATPSSTQSPPNTVQHSAYVPLLLRRKTRAIFPDNLQPIAAPARRHKKREVRTALKVREVLGVARLSLD